MSCAGLFIGAHLGFDYPGVWLHVDMAYPVHVVSDISLRGDGLVVSVSTSHAVGRRFIPKTFIKTVQTASLLGMQAFR